MFAIDADINASTLRCWHRKTMNSGLNAGESIYCYYHYCGRDRGACGPMQTCSFDV